MPNKMPDKMSDKMSDIKANAITLLNNELAELRKFVVLLSSEQQALLDNDTDTLLTLSAAKTQAANQLMEMGSLRRKSLLAPGIDTMEAWLETHTPANKKIWQEIRTLAAQSQALNTTNGELINSRMRNNQSALSVLYNSSKSAAGLYGPDGQANIGTSGRHIGSV